MLKIDNLSYQIGDKLLFDEASAVIDSGHKVGFIGRNGAGKTTLFALITGKLDCDAGAITVPSHWRVGITTQEAPTGEASLIDTVIGADAELTSLWREAETAIDATRISEIHDRLAQRQAYSAPARAARVLAGLGFDEATQQGHCGSFSGGWRMRVALASLLFTEPDLLLLDEPTNHLDLEATLWLEDYIARYQGTVLIISHDRDLLNRSVNEILHLDRAKMTRYQGNYDRFESNRRMQLELDNKLRVKQETHRAHIEKFVNRFRAKATKAKQAQSRLKMLERLPPPIAPSGERIPSFRFPEVAALAPPLFSLDRVVVGYGETPVLRDLSLRIDDDDRIALLGANGNGKTTFIKLLAGLLDPMSGNMVKSSKLRVGYFSQQLAERLDPSITPAQSLSRLRPHDTPEMCRTYLGRFGFSDDLSLGRIGSLSGGERARLVFAQIAVAKPHILLFDEPSNHLDMIARDALVQAINEFSGAVIIVSHDPHLIKLTVERFWLVGDGRVRPFEGDMSDYRMLTLRKVSRSETDVVPEPSQGRMANTNKKEKRRLAAKSRQDSTDVSMRVRTAEALFDRLMAEKTHLLERLADPDFYLNQPEEAKHLQKQLAGIQRDLVAAESHWMAAVEEMESSASA